MTIEEITALRDEAIAFAMLGDAPEPWEHVAELEAELDILRNVETAEEPAR